MAKVSVPSGAAAAGAGAARAASAQASAPASERKITIERGPGEPTLARTRRRRGGHLLDHLRLVHRRRVDLQHLEVVRALELVVHDARRLQHAVAGLEVVLALAL